MAGYAMTPANPPPPTAWYFPFQFDAGSQTSTLISESLEGLRVAATRQNAGRSRNACGTAFAAVAPMGVGGANAPAPTICAKVIAAFGSVRDAKLSHDTGAMAATSPSMVLADTESPMAIAIIE